MRCPKCNGKAKVTDTINSAENEIYRKRKCLACGHVFYTTEFEVEQTTEFLHEYRKAYRSNSLEWHRYGKRTYTIYLAKNDTIVATGTAEECANQMCIAISSFYSLVSRAKNQTRKKYEVFIDDGECDE